MDLFTFLQVFRVGESLDFRMLVLHAKHFSGPSLTIGHTPHELINISQKRLLVKAFNLKTLFLIIEYFGKGAVLLYSPICESEFVASDNVFSLEILNALATH